MRVAQLLTAVLDALDRDIKLDPGTSNGDVLRGIAMALAIRAAISAPPGTSIIMWRRRSAAGG